MANSPSFVAHVLDLLTEFAPVTARSMFGGHGLYTEGMMFALVDDDELFLKVDATSRSAFVEAGCRQWSYPGPKGPQPGNYFRPPPAALEDPRELRPWFELSLEAARRKLAAKVVKGAAAPRRAAPRKAAPKGTAKRTAKQPAKPAAPRSDVVERRSLRAAARAAVGSARPRPPQAAPARRRPAAPCCGRPGR